MPREVSYEMDVAVFIRLAECEVLWFPASHRRSGGALVTWDHGEVGRGWGPKAYRKPDPRSTAETLKDSRTLSLSMAEDAEPYTVCFVFRRCRGVRCSDAPRGMVLGWSSMIPRRRRGSRGVDATPPLATQVHVPVPRQTRRCKPWGSG